MADSTQKRKRAARRLERQRRQLVARPIGPRRDGPGWPVDPPREGPEDLDGGAGVREPRRPAPVTPAGALTLPEPSWSGTLDLTAVSHPA